MRTRAAHWPSFHSRYRLGQKPDCKFCFVPFGSTCFFPPCYHASCCLCHVHSVHMTGWWRYLIRKLSEKCASGVANTCSSGRSGAGRVENRGGWGMNFSLRGRARPSQRGRRDVHASVLAAQVLPSNEAAWSRLRAPSCSVRCVPGSVHCVPDSGALPAEHV